MLEKPDIQDARIITCLCDAYGLNVSQITFLPFGADRDTAVYRAVTDTTRTYFVKLRHGDFDEMPIVIPKFLYDQHIQQIIAPLLTRTRQLWARVGNFTLTVSPFVEGWSGFEINLAEHHWIELGQALKAIHLTVLPSSLTKRIQKECYSDTWREKVKVFQQIVQTTAFNDPISAELAAFLHMKQNEISELVRQAETLASILRTQSQPFVLCHADIHAGNVLIDTDDRLYLVDWDTLICAPKEHDLMFIGAGIGGVWHNAQEETLFYQGYGQTEIDSVALAYYRCERIVQDIAAYCEQILLTDAGGKDREKGLHQLTGQFSPNSVVEIARRSLSAKPRF